MISGPGFWLTGVLVGLVLAIGLWYELRAAVEAHPDLKQTRSRLAVGMALLFSVPCGLIGILHYAGRFDNPGFFLTNDVDDPLVATGLAVAIATYVVAIIGLNSGQVSELISHMDWIPLSARGVRLWGTVLLAICLVGCAVASWLDVGEAFAVLAG